MLPSLLVPLLVATLALGASRDFFDFYDQAQDYVQKFGQLPLGQDVGPAAPVNDEHKCNSVEQVPHFPGGHPGKAANGSIYTVLSEKPEFSRLFKIINVSDDIVSLLNDSSANLTFFALPNHAFPKHPPHHGHTFDITGSIPNGMSLIDAIQVVESSTGEGSIQSGRPTDDQIKKFVTAILSYHVISDDLPLHALAKNSTYPTQLSHVFGALSNEAIRLRFNPGLPFPRVNYYAQVVKADIGATNGFIHVINRPLFIPLPVFETAFLLHQGFSTYTSAVQRSSLTDLLQYRFVPGSEEQHSVKGSSVVTAFIPSNKAFSKLPRNLQLFLFSPLGERVFKKLLQFHTVPDIALYTDWVLNATAELPSDQFEASDMCEGMVPIDGAHEPFVPKGTIVSNFTLPTALEDHNLNVLVVRIPLRLPLPKHGKKLGYVKRVFANGLPVFGYDGVALNGAFHVVDKLLSPRRHPHPKSELSVLCVDFSDPDVEDHDDWEDWEDWLLDWADEN